MYTEVKDNTPIPYEELRKKTLEENVVRLAEAFRLKDGDTANHWNITWTQRIVLCMLVDKWQRQEK